MKYQKSDGVLNWKTFKRLHELLDIWIKIELILHQGQGRVFYSLVHTILRLRFKIALPIYSHCLTNYSMPSKNNITIVPYCLLLLIIMSSCSGISPAPTRVPTSPERDFSIELPKKKTEFCNKRTDRSNKSQGNISVSLWSW